MGRGKGVPKADSTPTSETVEQPSSATAKASVPPAPDPIPFDSIKTAEEFSEHALAYVDAQLRRGPEGHRDLLLMFAEFSRRETQLEMLFAREINELPKLIYPWLRLIVKRENDVVGFVDTLFQTAADTPEWFDAIADETLSLITEVIGPILPGMTSDKMIARIRKNLGRVREKGEGALPPALAEHFDELTELHAAWAGPLSVEEARTKLLDPSLSAAEKLLVLKRAPTEAVTGIELASILAPAIADNDYEAIQQIKRFNLGDRDLLALDEAVYAVAAKGEYSVWAAYAYLESTKRAEWTQQRPFIEEGIRRGGKVRSGMISLLQMLDDVPDSFVTQLLGMSDLSEGEHEKLEALLAEEED